MILSLEDMGKLDQLTKEDLYMSLFDALAFSGMYEGLVDDYIEVYDVHIGNEFEYLSAYDFFKREVIPIYEDTFTEDELRALVVYFNLQIQIEKMQQHLEEVTERFNNIENVLVKTNKLQDLLDVVDIASDSIEVRVQKVAGVPVN